MKENTRQKISDRLEVTSTYIIVSLTICQTSER